jgi:hypothetical protein
MSTVVESWLPILEGSVAVVALALNRRLFDERHASCLPKAMMAWASLAQQPLKDAVTYARPAAATRPAAHDHAGWLTIERGTATIR